MARSRRSAIPAAPPRPTRWRASLRTSGNATHATTKAAIRGCVIVEVAPTSQISPTSTSSTPVISHDGKPQVAEPARRGEDRGQLSELSLVELDDFGLVGLPWLVRSLVVLVRRSPDPQALAPCSVVAVTLRPLPDSRSVSSHRRILASDVAGASSHAGDALPIGQALFPLTRLGEGILPRTCVPPPGSERMTSSPPTAPTRSSMLVSPVPGTASAESPGPSLRTSKRISPSSRTSKRARRRP